MPRVRAKGRVMTRNEVAYYAINDRSAGRKVIELDLMTEAGWVGVESIRH
jgi:hypothetical protein